mgnify:CR=1 FL=1
MTNSILLLTHGTVGEAMLQAASNTIGNRPENLLSLSVNVNPNPALIFSKLETIIAQQNGKSLLILTDLFGATPCNLATKLSQKDKVAIISGVNLGMLLRSINYIHLPLKELANKAHEGGKDCIKTCE